MSRLTPLLAPVLLISLLFPAVSRAQSRQTFNPNMSFTGGNTYGGVSFSGVGGAIASCTNIGGLIGKGLGQAQNSVSTLFKSKSATDPTANTAGGQAVAARLKLPNGGSIIGQSVPTADDVTRKKLEEANRRENCLNGVAYAIAKNLLQQVTNRTLNWVNTGFNGNPLYIRDMNSYLSSISDQQTARLLQTLPQDNPIFGNAIRSIITEQISGINDGLIYKTMDTPAARSYQEFQDDFASGGWEALVNPSYNPISSIFDTADRLTGAVTTEQENVKAELERNGGFLDMKKCVEFATTSITAGTSTGDCLRWETVTPGSVISAQINTVTTSPLRQLEQADQINEVLGTFFDQLLSKLFSDGLSSIRGKSGQGISFGGIGTNVIYGTNGQPITSTGTSDILGYQASASGVITNDFDITRPQQLRAILEAQYNYLIHAQDARVALNRIVPTLGALDYCIPGPNPTWQTGLQDNANNYFSSLQEVQKDSSLGRRLLQSLPIIGSLFGGDRESHTLAAVDVQLYDKAISSSTAISDTVYHEDNRSTNAIFNNIQLRFNEVTDFYKNTFTKDAIKNAFVAADPTNSAYASGFVDTSFIETSKLPQYDQALGVLDTSYGTSIQDTREAVEELETIRTEVTNIVATAKARYIAERSAAGTPVNLSCINDAYKIDTSPITPDARQELDNPSPFYNQSIQGATYFYSHL